MLVRALLLVALMLGGCSVAGVGTDWISDDVAGPEPTYYRYLVATSLDNIMGKDRSLRQLELSRPRRVDLVKGAAWLACLKLLPNSAQRSPVYYGVVIQREHVAESRIAVGTDECEIQPYAPFDWAVEASHPPPQ